MSKILIVGEHPYCGSGTGNMMAGILSTIDASQHEIAIFAYGDPAPDTLFDTIMSFPIVSSHSDRDPWGGKKLLSTINTIRPDLVFFVGLDVWRYAHIYPEMLRMAQAHSFKTMCLAPYDLPTLRQDWLVWFSVFDHVLIYSESGHGLVAPYLNSSAYFRPPAPHLDFFARSQIAREYGRRTSFPHLSDEAIIVGFVGNNQFRKDPMGLIEGFALAAAKDERLHLYLHTNMQGVFNLPQLCADAGIRKGAVLAKDQAIYSYPTNRLVQVYNAMDMIVMCSAFEGLSYTPLEAMKCGVPVIVSNCPAHRELVEDAGIYVGLTVPYMVPVPTAHGDGFTRVKSCRPEAIAKAIGFMLQPDVRHRLSRIGIEQAVKWLSGTMDINAHIDRVLSNSISPASDQIDAVLFAQHSAAGDVLMTTQCFKGLKKKHPGKRLVYMTQKKFHNIVEDHPDLDEVIDWNPDMMRRYSIVYNPHGERIVTGGFNSLDTALYEMYPYFCGQLEADTVRITKQRPELHADALPEKYIIVQTAGGSKEYRTYEHMDLVLAGTPLPVVQIGSHEDPLCRYASLDLRGKLSFQESAWVVGHATAGVVIDSFPAHLCGALGTPAVVLYGPAPARVTHPRDDNGVIVNLEPNRLDACPILTTCWGAPSRRPCKTPCINTIKPEAVRAALLTTLADKGITNE